LSKVAYFNLSRLHLAHVYCGYRGKRLTGSSCHLVRRYRPYPRPHCARWGTQLPLSEKGTQQPPLFGPCLLWPNGRPSQQLPRSCAKWIHTAVFDHATYRYNQLAGRLRGAELPLCHVALLGAVSSDGVLLTNQRRRVACSVDDDRFSCGRRSGNAGVDADDWSMGQMCESAKLY